MEDLESEGNAWVFDSLVGFLHGPIWNVPLQTFIEERSLPFEPTDDGEVVERAEYKKIHTEYRNLVDVMLGSFMDDIGITAEQFEAACKLSARDLAGLPAHFHRRLFEQIWAANDYEMFVKMMTHKNVELQLQALELIESRFGAMPSIFASDSKNLETNDSREQEWPDNDDVMTEIKKLRISEISDDKDEPPPPPPEVVVTQKQSLISKLNSFDKKDSVPKKVTIQLPEEEEDEFPIETVKPPVKVEVSEDELRVRQEYLKQQRDKLLALKKQVREKRLGAAETELELTGAHKAISRPRSARVAQEALAGSTPDPSPDAMQLRRALASKLKTEVVDMQL